MTQKVVVAPKGWPIPVRGWLTTEHGDSELAMPVVYSRILHQSLTIQSWRTKE